MKFSNLKFKWKIVLLLGVLLVPSTGVGLLYILDTVKNLEVYTALSGLMNFVDSKQQGVIRFLGQNEKLAQQLAKLVEDSTPEIARKQFLTIVESDVFKLEDHHFKKEIEEGSRHIATWEVYHAIDFVRNDVIEISSDANRIGRKVNNAPDVRNGYSDVYLEEGAPILSFGAKSGDGMVYVHANAGMLTNIVNGEIGNLEGDMGAYYLAGVGQTFDYYIVNRENVMVTESRVHKNALLNIKGSEFPWLMTMGKAVELGIKCLPDGTYKTNAGHYTGQREAMGFYNGLNGREMLGVSMPFYDSEWTIVVEQEATELLGPLYSMTSNITIGAMIVLGLIVLMGTYFASTISRPLTYIVGDIKRLMKEDTDVSIHETGRKDEIGDLANAVEIFSRYITEKKGADEKLHILSRALEQNPSAVFITDTEGNIQYVNPRFTELTGYSAEEAMGQNPRLLKSSDTSRTVHSDIWKTILEGKEWRGEIKDRHKNGRHFWAYATIAPVKNMAGEITQFVAIHEDISKRKEAEDAVKSALVQAEVANRAKSDLMANMSHELRTPLNAIIGFSSAINEETFGPLHNEKYQDYINDIRHSGEHLLDLINDILDVSAIEAGAVELHEEPLILSEIIDASLNLIKPRAEKGRVFIASSINHEAPMILADVRRMKQIFLNLFSNAVKFTPEGGEVTVSANLNADSSLDLIVQDTGIGMDAKDIRIALSTFGQADSSLNRQHEGTGLGLPLTKGLIELHSGKLKIESDKGHGTKIIVTIPKERVITNTG